MSKRVATALMLLALSACSSNPNEHKPSPLPALPAKAERQTLHRQWAVSVGDGLADDVVRLQAAVQADRYYAASRDGVVVAVDSQGHVAWKQKTRLPLTGGVAAGYGLVVVASAKGEVLALDAATGETRWRRNVPAPVLAPAALTADTVVIQGNDGKVYGLNPQDGVQRWVYDTPVPTLSLRGYASPLPAGELLIVATAAGKVVALDPKTGIGRWESRIATPEGRSELGRMIDVDGDMLYGDDQTLYVASYQGQLSALAVDERPALRWTVPVSSFQALAAGQGRVYVVDAGDNILAIDQSNGQTVWKDADFAWRGLSNAVTLGDSLVVGDRDGYLHVLNQQDGRLRGRVRVKGAVVSLRAVQDRVLVYTAKGQFSSWSLPVQ